MMNLNLEKNLDSLNVEYTIEYFIKKLEKYTKSYVMFEDDQVYYSELLKKIDYVAKYFNSFKNEIITLMIPNSIDFIVYYLAIIKSGNIVMPIDYKTKIGNLLKILTTSESKIVLHNKTNFAICDEKIITINCNDINQLNDLSKLKLNRQYRNYDVIYCTSGSTSNPKYVCFRFDAIFRNIISNVKALNIENDDCFLVSLPMNFSYCLHAHVLSHLYKGANLIIKPNSIFSNKAFVNLLKVYKISSFATVPTFVRQIKKYLANEKLTNLKKIYVGADFCDLDTRIALKKDNPNINFYYTYGMTEAGPRISTYKFDINDKANNSVGIALDICQIKIMVDGREAAKYEKGEITVKSQSLMLGYLGNSELTNKTIIDGWLHTGDLGYVDNNGNLYLVGRIKNIIKINGLLISPEEIEEVIKKIDKIENAFVYYKDGILMCDLVLKENSKEFQVMDSIKSNCIKFLPQEKIPKNFRFVKQLELTNSGKIKR